MDPLEVRRRNVIQSRRVPVRVDHRAAVRQRLAPPRRSRRSSRWPTTRAAPAADGGPRRGSAARHRLRALHGADRAHDDRVPEARRADHLRLRLGDAAHGSVRPGARSQVSSHNHGQGHETTFAQLVADELGADDGRRARAVRRHVGDAVRPRHVRQPQRRAGRRREHAAPPARCASCSCGSRREELEANAGDLEVGRRRASACVGSPERGVAHRRPRPLGLPPAGAAARGHGAAARGRRHLRRRARHRHVRQRRADRRWSRSTPRPAPCASSATGWSRTAAR